MKNIPEINHCIPNPEAYWCCDCKAHTAFGRSVKGNSQHETYKCKVCERGMFIVSELQYFKFLGLGCGGVFAIAGLAMIGMGWQMLVGMWTIGAIFGLIGGGFWYFTRSWTAWCAVQGRKTEDQLEQEGLSHPFQPEYEDSHSFYDWAGQFFESSEEWKQFQEKYGQGEEPADEKGEASDPLDAPSPSPPPADLLDD